MRINKAGAGVLEAGAASGPANRRPGLPLPLDLDRSMQLMRRPGDQETSAEDENEVAPRKWISPKHSTKAKPEQRSVSFGPPEIVL